MKELVVGQTLISYSETFGQGSGPVIVFLHGWRSNKEAWNQVMQSMQNTVYGTQVVAVDLPGFGSSPVPKKPWSVGDYAEVIKGFIEKLGLKNVILVGHSFGGRVGIKLASTYPDLVNKLVLVDSAGFVFHRNSKAMLGLIAKVAKPFFAPKFMQGLRRRVYKSIGAEDYLATPELQKTFINITQEDLSEDMKKIVCKTLIVTGENDTDTPLAFGQKMNSLIRNSQFIVLKDAGHFSFIDKQSEFVSLLTSFVQTP